MEHVILQFGQDTIGVEVATAEVTVGIVGVIVGIGVTAGIVGVIAGTAEVVVSIIRIIATTTTVTVDITLVDKITKEAEARVEGTYSS